MLLWVFVFLFIMSSPHLGNLSYFRARVLFPGLVALPWAISHQTSQESGAILASLYVCFLEGVSPTGGA